ncbi:hypothetical protein GDO81_025730 [Engystomops pustulosus]|uniref:Ig-like domain-containing protein n=1 Tax=Engystomops pustulosus TaxID=76066 RepID=A0AAV6ZLC4_ENGPU|nr:hypothetical protein GDO81_025730 [Engystomops pustulosus]KAG8548325.1 hypothetical protein GDO81_025730 [Engystomops pustulosus]
MQWVPTSMLVYVGDDAKIHCNFEQEKNEVVEVSWHLIHRTMNMTSSPTYSETRQTNLSATTKILSIPNTKKSDSGLYQCRVTARGRSLWSCGTYLRVRDPPVYLFFNVAEATKNRLITAEGIILMLCAIIPGSLLLYKRCQVSAAHRRIWEAYSPAGKDVRHDYTSLTAVELLTIQGPCATM